MDFQHCIAVHQSVVEKFSAECVPTLSRIAELCAQALKGGKRIFLCGNGGSAADSQHIAAELVGRFETERRGLPAIALTTDTSNLTSIGNDYGYERIFARQVEALVREGDVLIGFSTSGSSKNIVKAFEAAKEKGAVLIAMTGEKEGALAKLADACLKVPSPITARVQECHIMAGHMICGYIDEVFSHEGA